jgi:hypothetical protein
VERDTAGVPVEGLEGVRLGMTRAQLRSARPRIYDNSGDLEEELRTHQKAFYVFGGDLHGSGRPATDHLVGVIVSQTIRTPDREAVRASVDRIARSWTREAGIPAGTAASLVQRRTGIVVPVRVVVWTSPNAVRILTYDSDSAMQRADFPREVNAIVQAPSLPLGAFLPAPLNGLRQADLRKEK